MSIEQKLTCCRRDQGPRGLLVSLCDIDGIFDEADQNSQDVHNRG